MNTNDLLERRATRGEPRGAANVWANAQPELAHARPEPPSRIGLRLAIVAVVVGLVAFGLLADRTGDDLDTADDEQPTEIVDSEELLPPPILHSNMTLGRVSRPIDPEFDGDDDIFDDVFAGAPAPIFNDLDEQGTTTMIFAREDEPFRGPVLGLTLFGSGGFRPWGLNMTQGEFDDLVSRLSQSDGSWVLPEDSGLVEVRRFDDDPYFSLRFGWQFDFGEGSAEAILQSEVANHEGRSIDEWTWIARLVGGEFGWHVDIAQPDLAQITPTTVLGHDAIILQPANVEERTDTILWSSDDFVHRLTASRIEGNTSFARSAVDEAALLGLVDRAEWIAAVDDAEGTRFGVAVVVVLLMISAGVFAVIALALLQVLRRRRYRALNQPVL